jgi:hypothetical protein
MTGISIPHIDSFRFGQVVIDGQSYTSDIIILPHRVLPGWWRERGHVLQLSDLEDVMEAKPAALVVGQGTFSRMRIADDAVGRLQAAGIELIALPTKEACQRYNALREKGDVAAALHLTC